MKDVTPALLILLANAGGMTPLVRFDTYTITLADGTTQLRYGTADFTIGAEDATIWDPDFLDGSGGMWFDGINWAPGMVDGPESRSTGRWKTGLDADTWNMRMAPRAWDPVTEEEFPDKIGDRPWLEAARVGILDNADLIVSTAYYAAMPEHPVPIAGVSPVGTIIKFRGLVGEVQCSNTAAYVQATDYRVLLQQMMPRNQYQASCRHRLYDRRCSLLSTNFDVAGTVYSATGPLIQATGPVAAPPGSGTFELGTMTMTSGPNNGLSRLVQAWNGAAQFKLLNPFPYDPSNGETFLVTAGCDKSTAHCQLFSNIENFGAEPLIPMPEVSLA